MPWLSFGTVVGLVIATLIIPVHLPAGDDINLPSRSASVPVGLITSDITVAQQFPASGTGIRTIGILFGTYRRVNQSMVRVTLSVYRNTRWETLVTRQLPASTLGDNEMATLTFDPPLTVAVGQPTRITVQTDAGPNQAVTWWVDPDYQPDGYQLLVNGRQEQGTAHFQVAFQNTSGRLLLLLPAVVKRATPLLDRFWLGVFLAAITVFFVGCLRLGRRLPDAIPTARAPISPVDSAEDEAILRPVGTSGAPVLHSGQEGQG